MVSTAINPRRLEQAVALRVLLAADPCALAAKEAPDNAARDRLGLDDCIQALALTRAVQVRATAVAALEAGADVLLLDTPRLQDSDLADAGFALAYAAAELACQAIDAVAGAGRRRFLLGRVDAAETPQVAGLIAGGVDALIAEEPAALASVVAAAEAETGQRVPLLDGRRLALATLEASALPKALAQGARLVTGSDLAGLDAALRAAAADGWRPMAAGVAPEEVQTPSSLHQAAGLGCVQSAA
ncbi:hypothetical protein ABWI00_08620 [Algihabitans albus]|uniref:hypothetical protein n=1 Tax=Algihabitans albus TaxID=2164067 RepID=UPI0035CFBF51